MPNYKFIYPMEVRFSDLDAMGHLNHAQYLTFIEQARIKYFAQVGLWRVGESFESLGQIVAHAACDYKRPVELGQVVEVAVCTTRLGNKSLEMVYRLTVNEVEVALGRTVQVAYDYQAARAIPVPDHWRDLIRRFEGETL